MGRNERRGSKSNIVTKRIHKPLSAAQVEELKTHVLEAQRAGDVHATLKAYRKLHSSIPHAQVVREARKAAQTQGKSRSKTAAFLKAKKETEIAEREPRRVYFSVNQVAKRLQTARGENVPSEVARNAAQRDLDRSLLILLHNREDVMKSENLKPLQRLQRENREFRMLERVIYVDTTVKEFIRQHEARGLVFWFDCNQFIPRTTRKINIRSKSNRAIKEDDCAVKNSKLSPGKPQASNLAAAKIPKLVLKPTFNHRVVAEALSKWISQVLDPATGNRYNPLTLRSSWWARTWNQPKYTQSSHKVVHTVNDASRDANAVMQLITTTNPTLVISDAGGRGNWTMLERRQKLSRISAYAQRVVNRETG